MRILITGGLGFIGTNLIRKMGGHKIAVLDDYSKAVGDSVANKCGILVVKGDIRETDSVRFMVAGADCVVHLAAISGVQDCNRDPDRARSINVDGVSTVIEECKVHDIPFILASSVGAVLGNQHLPAHENQFPSPTSIYGHTKRLAEGIVLKYHKGLVLRFTNVYGPYSSNKTSLVHALLRKVYAGEVIDIYGGEQTRDFVYVSDLCQGIIKAVENKEYPSNRVFHLGTGKETTINELLSIVGEVTQSKIIINKLPAREETQRSYTDISKARNILGYVPVNDLKTGVKKTWSRIYKS